MTCSVVVLLVTVTQPLAPDVVDALLWPDKELVLAKHQQRTGAKSGTGFTLVLALLLERGII